jgi:CubicO group peptidase (beta-lactamase class C family)
MDIAITLLPIASVGLLLAALLTLFTPLIVAPILALIRRDPNGAFVPHSDLMRSRFFAGVYALVALLILIGFQPRPFKKTPGFVPAVAAGSPEAQERIRQKVAPRIQSGEVLGMVVGVVDPSGTQVFGFGQRRLGAPPPDGQTVFEIGEVSRTFTTWLLEQMVLRGQVKLDQPVRDLLPDSVSVPTVGDETITIEQLATDRSGLPSRPDNLSRSPLEWFPPFDNPYGGYSARQLDAYLSAADLSRKPGANIEPSTLGMGLLAHALGRATNTKYDAMVTREICDPLAMADTRVGISGNARARAAQGYVVGRWSYKDWRVASPTHPWSYRALTGAGGLSSTANDLLSFLRAHLGLQSTDLASAMNETRQPRYRGRGLDAVALGWSVRLGGPSSSQVTWCRGATRGTRSWIGMDESRRVGVVILANTATEIDELGFDLLRSLP